MSALEKLDRYIERHEVTLQSISKQKLERKSVHKSEHSLVNISNASLFDASLGFHYQPPSIDSELQSLIMRLKQLQQSRLAQLQQANALFLHEMNIEDQFNMEIRTADEHNEALAEEEFEAFLLGESHPNKAVESPVATSPIPPTPPVHQTLFTKKSLLLQQTSADSISNKNAQNSTLSSADLLDTTTTTTSNTPFDQQNLSLNLSFTDDVMQDLQRSRMDRTQRLRNIATSIQCLGAQTAKYPISTFKNDLLNLSALPPPPPPPVLQSMNTSTHHSTAYIVTSNATQYTQPTNLPQRQNVPPPEAPITLQSILDDAQFDVTPPPPSQPLPTATALAAVPEDANSMDVTHSAAVAQHATSMPITTITRTNHTTTDPTFVNPSNSSGNSTYLKNNRSRKALEQELVENAKHNLSVNSIHPHTTHTNTASHQYNTTNNSNINIHTAHSAHLPVPRSPTARTINFNTANTSTDSIHGIGYGSRYTHNQHNHYHNYHHTSYTNNSNHSMQLDWDESSVGSGDSSVHENISHNSNVHHHNNKHSSSGIFEYADALESPGVKSGRHKQHTHTTSSNNTTHTSNRTDNSNANVLTTTKHVAFAPAPAYEAPTVQLQRAAAVQSRVSDYYQRRMRRLEHGAELEQDEQEPHNMLMSSSGTNSGNTATPNTTMNSNSTSNFVPEYEAYSPERPPSTAHTYDSPLPKTPTFPPIFS